MNVPIVRLVILWFVVLLPAAGRAQSSGAGAITGVVRDTSGAVIPGVTVEAASPALIDRVRSVVSDERGLYRIVDLRPGSYNSVKTTFITDDGTDPVDQSWTRDRKSTRLNSSH